MPEPLKNIYTKQFISDLSAAIKKEYKSFNSKSFSSSIFNKQWDDEELKQRMRHITESLHQHLPNDYKKSLTILKPASKKFGGFEAMFFPDYVEVYGMDDYKESVAALETFTKYSSSEFAVRPFIIQYEKKMMAQMEKWAESKNHHVRRLSSEGCRPRLPWAMALPRFKTNPESVLRVITNLLNDSSEYVRRSAANNLNDISKDNPEVVLQITNQYLGKTVNTDKLLKHACRTLLKAGNTKVLRLFGYSNPNHIKVNNFTIQPTTNIGDSIVFSFTINSTKKPLGKTRIEYAMDFMKANGKQARKIFKISESDYKDNAKAISKKHSFKLISTRKYYPGKHSLAIIINGKQFAQLDFQLRA